MKKPQKHRDTEKNREGNKRLAKIFVFPAFSVSVGTLLLVSVSLCLCGLLSATAVAQSGRKVTPPPGVEDKSVIRVETREVHLPLRAWDPKGQNISDLKPQDLLIVEDGQERPVTWLRNEPANVVLVLDLNNEIGTFKNGPSRLYDTPPAPDKDWKVYEKPKYEVIPNPAARDLADSFVMKLSPNDQLAIIQYSDKVQLVQNWTLNRQEAIDSLKSKFRAGIKAKFHDALTLAAEKLMERESGRRIIVLLSDGTDSGSRKRLQEAFNTVTRAQATVFVISWTTLLRNQITSMMRWTGAHERQTSATYKRGAELSKHLRELGLTEATLKELAEASGGEMLSPEDFDEFYKTADTVTRDIGAQYTLAFITERSFGIDDRHYVEVISRRPGITLRTRKRYEMSDDLRPLPGKRLQFVVQHQTSVQYRER